MSTRMSTRYNRRVTLFLLGGSLLTGCAQSDSGQSNCNDCYLIMALDSSKSFQPHIPVSAHLVMQETGQVKPAKETILTFANRIKIFKNGTVTTTGSQLESDLRKFCPAPGDSGTRPGLLLPYLAKLAEDSDLPEIHIRVYTDCDNDENTPASWAAIKKAAQSLANNSRVRDVVILGADGKSDSWAKMAAALSALKGRLHMLPPSDINFNALNRTAPVATKNH